MMVRIHEVSYDQALSPLILRPSSHVIFYPYTAIGLHEL